MCRTHALFLALSASALAAFTVACGDDDTAMDPITESDAGSSSAEARSGSSSGGPAAAPDASAPADSFDRTQTRTVKQREDPARATDVGAYRVEGSCGVLGLLGPGFTLTAGPVALPVGTKVVVSGSGLANVGVMTATGAPADVAVLSDTARSVTLTEQLPAGGAMSFRTALSVSVVFELTAAVELPEGYTATGEKPEGTISATAVLCSAE